MALSSLTSITRNLPPIIKDPASSLLGTNPLLSLSNESGDHCYAVLVENLDIFDAQCLKLGISKGLGLGIVVAGSIVKLPQLLKLVNAKSGEGLSVIGYVLETISYIVTLAYNVRLKFPFSTYGETAFISVQNVAIILLILHFAKKDVYAAGVLGGVLAFAAALFEPRVVPYRYLQILQGLSIPLSLASKLPQIVTNYQNGSTGQLSAFTVFNYLAGSLARVFTTLTEVNDPFIFWGFVLAATLNAVLAAQMVIYWKSSPNTPVVPPAIKTPTTPKRSTRQRKSALTTPTTPTTPKTSTEKPKTPKSPSTASRKGRPKKKT